MNFVYWRRTAELQQRDGVAMESGILHSEFKKSLARDGAKRDKLKRVVETAMRAWPN